MRLPAPGANSRVVAKLWRSGVGYDGGMMTIDERLVELLMDAEDRCRQGECVLRVCGAGVSPAEARAGETPAPQEQRLCPAQQFFNTIW